MNYRAFAGANGWYVAWKHDDGSHYQTGSGHLSEAQALREAARRNASGHGDEDDDDDNEYWGNTDPEED